MKIPFLSATATALDYRKPEPSAIPSLDGLQVGAAYCIARMGGDYFEFLSPSPTRLVFALFDISGQRNQSLEIAAHVQDVLRARAPELFANDDINETEAIAALALEVNRVVLRAAEAKSSAKNGLCKLSGWCSSILPRTSARVSSTRLKSSAAVHFCITMSPPSPWSVTHN